MSPQGVCPGGSARGVRSRGGGFCSRGGVSAPGGLCLEGCLLGEVSAPGGGLVPEGCLLWGVSALGGVWSWRVCSRGVCSGGGGIPECTETDPSPSLKESQTPVKYHLKELNVFYWT